jgi:hypothetical protein
MARRSYDVRGEQESQECFQARCAELAWTPLRTRRFVYPTHLDESTYVMYTSAFDLHICYPQLSPHKAKGSLTSVDGLVTPVHGLGIRSLSLRYATLNVVHLLGIGNGPWSCEQGRHRDESQTR